VDAALPGAATYQFVLKAAGLSDAYFSGQPPAFLIDRTTYGGRWVRVSARASGAAVLPWAPEIQLLVPPVKLYGIDDANGPKGASGDDARGLGITLDRVQLTLATRLRRSTPGSPWTAAMA
jgi:hypothetical protein